MRKNSIFPKVIFLVLASLFLSSCFSPRDLYIAPVKKMSYSEIRDITNRCNSNQPKFCFYFAEYYGRLGEKELEKEYYKIACNQRLLRACVELTSVYYDTTPEGMEEKLEYLTFACNQGNITGCIKLGRNYAYNDYVKRDLSRASTLFQRVCESGNSDEHLSACHLLADIYLRKEPDTENVEIAKRLNRVACEVDHLLACKKLNELYVNAGDASGFIKIFSTACREGNLNAYNTLANSIVKANLSRKTIVLQKRCILMHVIKGASVPVNILLAYTETLVQRNKKKQLS